MAEQLLLKIMNLHWLKVLRCPMTGSSLKLKSVVLEQNKEVVEGVLSTEDDTKEYLVKDGIVLFSKQNTNYTESFGFQWEKFGKVQFEDQNVGKPMEGYTSRMLSQILDGYEIKPKELIIEGGCGSGRFLDLALKAGAHCIGLDYSFESLKVTRKNLESYGYTNLLLVQCDLTQMIPLKEKCADAIYSIGVLHHTSDPKRAFKNLTLCLKEKGWFACHVYSKGNIYDNRKTLFYRKIFKFLYPFFGYYPPLAYSYFISTVVRPFYGVPLLGLITKFFVVAMPKDRKWCLLDTFDALTPSYQTTHKAREVFDWYYTNGFTNMRPTTWNYTSWTGVKK